MIRIGFIGVGNMARAIIKSLKKTGKFFIGGFDIAGDFNNVCKKLGIKKTLF